MRLALLIPALALTLTLAGCDSGGNDDPGTTDVVELVAGEGTVVEVGMTLMVTYTGMLEDGTEFDSTDERGEPWIFTLIQGQVLQGWIEGLPGMRVGGSRRLTIPPGLAFGRNGVCYGDGTCPVPPNATVVYEIKVESIVDDVLVEDLVIGDGAVADNGKQLAVDYTGTFLDGRVFDSTGLSGQPFVFTLGFGSVIEGWDRGLIGMKVGGIRQLTIPPAMAYGAYGVPGSIPPYTTLRFKVELLDLR